MPRARLSDIDVGLSKILEWRCATAWSRGYITPNATGSGTLSAT